MRKVLISIGNRLKSDDDVANVVIGKIRTSRELLLIKGGTNPENFVSRIRDFGPEKIYFLDAVDFKGGPGDVRLFPLDSLKGISMSSTHNVSLEMFSKLFPGCGLFVIGIQPKKLGFGEGLSRELESRIPEIADRVKRLLQDGS